MIENKNRNDYPVFFSRTKEDTEKRKRERKKRMEVRNVVQILLRITKTAKEEIWLEKGKEKR